MRRALAILLVTTVAAAAWAQEISEKKEIAIFRLSHYEHDIPDDALGSIDEELKAVFINLGRFDVLGMTYRLGQDDVGDFIDKVKEFKGETVEIPEEFQMGREIFTEKDMSSLIGSFYVIIPAVTHFSVVKNTKKLISGETKTTWDAEITTSFTFINVEETTTFAQFFVETSGSSEDAEDRAVQSAVKNIPMELEFKITKIPEFTLKTAVLERNGGEVVIELGRNMGIRLGYEFAVMSSRVLSSGRVFESETGMLIVKEVGEEVTLTTLIFGDAQEGDQLKEIPRYGIELTPYFEGLLDPFNGFSFSSVLGARAVMAKGFYAFRPLGGLELPIPLFTPEDSLVPWLWVFGFPFNAYVGGERIFYLRRLHITPQAAIGAGMLIPWLIETEDPILTHIGGWVNLNLAFLVNRDTKVTFDVGYKQWVGIFDALTVGFLGKKTSYGGVMLGAGVTFKF